MTASAPGRPRRRHPAGPARPRVRPWAAWWAKTRLYVALYLVPGNTLRCGCLWHPVNGVVRAAHCLKHGQL